MGGLFAERAIDDDDIRRGTFQQQFEGLFGTFGALNLRAGSRQRRSQALVNGLLARIRRELAEASGLDPADITTILTGGLAAAPWAADLEAISINDPDLTLKGLAILHAEVAGGVPLDLGLR